MTLQVNSIMCAQTVLRGHGPRSRLAIAQASCYRPAVSHSRARMSGPRCKLPAAAEGALVSCMVKGAHNIMLPFVSKHPPHEFNREDDGCDDRLI
jgi:hypothetical protein